MMEYNHALSMEQYAQDASINTSPWNQWEYSHVETDDWQRCSRHPSWAPTLQFRRKTSTVRINNLEFPARFFIPPRDGNKYWFITTETQELYDSAVWSGDETDFTRLNRGFVFPCEQTVSTASAAIFGELGRGEGGNESHHHAELMSVYAKDATKTRTPWLSWEVKNSDGSWQLASTHPSWDSNVEYRQILPTADTPTQNVTFLDQSEAKPQLDEPCSPLVTAPEVDSIIWMLSTDDPEFVREGVWSGSTSNLTLLERSMLFATKEKALRKAKTVFK